MEEKKPTIEEIVKSIENCKKNDIENTCQYCYTCPASIWDFEEGITECTVDLFQKTIDLIHRLQSENAEQKTEIERLTEENGQIFDKIYDFIEFRQKRMVEPYKDALTYILRELKEEFGGKNETV